MSLWKYDCFGTSYLNSNQVYSYFFPTAYIGRNMLHSMITKRTYLPIFSHTTTATLLARRLRIGIGIMLRHKDNRSACTICGQLWGKKRYQNCRDYQRYYKRGYWQYLKQKCRVQQPSSVAASCRKRSDQWQLCNLWSQAVWYISKDRKILWCSA